jgi:hypothetical protein
MLLTAVLTQKPLHKLLESLSPTPATHQSACGVASRTRNTTDGMRAQERECGKMRAHGIDCVLEAADAGVDGHTAGTEVGMWKNAHARPQRLTAGVSLRYFNLVVQGCGSTS